jgi:glutathione peroxidase
MMKTILFTILFGFSSFLFITKNNKKIEMEEVGNTFYDISIKGIDGKDMPLTKYKGKKILIVNVASECGYTPQYEQLEELYKAHSKSLIVLGCPSNDFGGQEPGSSEEIVAFCKKNYGVTFPLTEKVGIKKDTHPIYQWLTQKAKNGVSDNEVKWNFTKFLIDEKGTLVHCFPSSVTPLDDKILDWVK